MSHTSLLLENGKLDYHKIIKKISRMKNKLLFLVIITLTLNSCKENTNEKKQVVSKKTEQVQIIKDVEKPTLESKLNGQFTFDLTHQDKAKWKKTSRAYAVRNGAVSALNLDLTFYGNGKGVMFHDNGNYEYMTKKMIDNAKFNYEIKNDTIFISDLKGTTPFGIIIDEAINKDYFEIDIIGSNNIGMTFGMYKIGDSPKTTPN
jgi:uncharacterized protein YueI